MMLFLLGCFEQLWWSLGPCGFYQLNPFSQIPNRKKKENQNFLYIQYLLTRSCEETKIPTTAVASINSGIINEERKEHTPWVYHIQLTWRHIVPYIFLLFLSTWAEVSTSSNTNRLQDLKPGFHWRTQLHAKPEEPLSTPESSWPAGECWVLSASQEQEYSCTELLNVTFLSFVSSQQPCCFLYINWQQDSECNIFLNILYTETYSFTGGKKKRIKGKNVIFLLQQPSHNFISYCLF